MSNNTDNCATDGRKYAIKAEKEKAEKVIPAIIAQDDVIFDKEETIKYPKSAKEDEYDPYCKVNFITVFLH